MFCLYFILLNKTLISLRKNQNKVIETFLSHLISKELKYL